MKKHILPLSIILISILIWLTLFNKISVEVPTHWNIAGEVDDVSSKTTAFFMLHGTMIAIYLLLIFIPKIDPKKANYPFFQKSYSMIVVGIMEILFAISIATLYIGLGHELNMTKLIAFIFGFLFIIIGNFTQQIKPNYFVGIRTPWTLANEIVWRKTHQLDAKIFVLGGLLTMSTCLLPSNWSMPIIIVVLIMIVIVPVVYSYFLFKRISGSNHS